ncbi:MAG TPA: alpha-amylase family protein [Ilumatobacteraceae bacterium]|jgi:trehalose synthase|nr:alpha-amylase family protein [Ilumatobacteraceae bacterium]
MSIPATADLWWKNAIIYCLDVQTFADSDGDGIGDFGGLTRHVDDLAGLGVTCIWLMPFYPTADLDDGYDVVDHYAIDPRLGTFGDFTEFMAVARDRGLRVIADLVVNHTSDQHEWFQASRTSRESRYRDWYVWQDEIPHDGPEGVVFPDDESGVWTFDTDAGQYYLHRFYHHQPDLNIANHEVRDEIAKVIGFWLAQGLSGFRVDAVPFLLELEGIDDDMGIHPHDYLRDLRAFTQRRNGDAVLLGEVNLPFEQQRHFFGDDDGDELNMLFDFIGMQATFLAMARSDAGPIIRALRDRPEIPVDAAYASFLRNHDELTLDKLTDSEREEVFAAFGPDPDMQLFGRGLRRRLPPMLGGDQQWLRMAYSLMFAMPGAPTLFYGEEIGMGENLAVDGRLAVRTPMQWTAGPAAGFTTAPASVATRPFPVGEFGPESVNVAAQRTDPDSLLNWFERLIRLRKAAPEIGWGEWQVLDVDDDAVLVMQYRWDERTTITVHNLAAKAARVVIPLDIESATLSDRLGSSAPIAVKDGTATVKVAAHGYLWLRLEPAP